MQHRALFLRSLCTLILLGFLALLPPAALRAAGVIYVVPGGIGAQTGADWGSAKDLQAALTSAASGDEIWVKAGVYKPTTGTDRSATFQLKSGVALYGGFAGSEASRDQRDLVANVTILSGDLLGNDAGAVASTNATRGENSFHVVTGSGTDATAILDGFTITGGNAFNTPTLDLGGGILIQSGSPTLSRLIISNNSSVQAGGGMMDELNSNPTLDNVVFNNNTSKIGGGLLNYNQSNAIIRHSLFIGNTATDTGGGMVSFNNSHIIIEYTIFRANSAVYGGGMGNGSDSIIVNTIFISNTATLFGGGILNENSNSTIIQSTFSGNSSGTYGSAINNFKSNPTISQVTFSANQSKNNGGTLSNQSSNPLIHNSIFWGNQGGEIYNYLDGNAPDVQYSLIQGGYITGTQILDADPLFVDADGADNIAGTPDDDLRLRAGSPAIDAGNNAFIPADLTDDNANSNTSEPAPFDLAGNPRLTGTSVDLGAYETQAQVLITSAPPLAGTYGSGYNHGFTATASLPVTYSLTAGSLPPGIILNTTTGLLSGTSTAAGSYTGITITASNANSSDSQTFTIVINPAALTITADNKVKHIGVANPLLTASYSGFVNNDTPASLDTPISLMTTAAIASAPGRYPITASGAADANYTITFTSGTLTISSGQVYFALFSR